MRKLAILFLSLAVIFFFFAGFYLYYVPNNKTSLNNYGFLILHQLENALSYRIEGNVEAFSGNLQGVFDSNNKAAALDSVGKRLYRDFGVDTLLYIRGKADSVRGPGESGIPAKGINSRHPQVKGRFQDISNGRVRYLFFLEKGQDSMRVSLPIDKIMDNFQNGFPRDFFSGILFLKAIGNRIETLYKSDEPPLGLNIPTDSLLPGSKGAFYQGIADLHTGAKDLKLFYIPVTIGNRLFVLGGIKDKTEYDKAADEVPASFIYPLVIVLILLFIAMPLIKLFIIGPGEAIRLRDLLGYHISLLAGGMLITLIIIQVILLKDADIRQQRGLDTLTAQVDSAFLQELRQAYGQLQAIDQARASGSLPVAVVDSGVNFDVTRSLIPFMQHESDSGMGYFRFDRVAWVDNSGHQVVTGSLNTAAAPLFIDVSQRSYYQDFLNNKCYRLPGIDTSLISLQAVLSWTDGKFRIMLAKRSACDGAYLVTLSIDPSSVVRTVVPEDYWFCVIDANGQVQVHTDETKNLIDNIFQESADPGELQGAISAQQALDVTEANLYGQSEYGFRMAPIAGLPLYLMVFHYRGYILPVNMRILIFSLAGCGLTLSFAGMALVLCLFFRRRVLNLPAHGRSLLAGTMDYLQWLVPRKNLKRFYFLGWVGLLCWLAVLALTAILFGAFAPGVNRTVMYLLLANPWLVAGGLTVIAWRSRGPQSDTLRHTWHYSLLVFMLALVLGAVPAALFTWYGHNQEILQSVKRTQLSTALEVAGRQQVYDSVLGMDLSLDPYGKFEQWQYEQGIYHLFPQKIDVGPIKFGEPQHSTGFDRTYFDAAGLVGTDFFLPADLPPLEDEPADHLWRWVRPFGDSLPFIYNLDPDANSGAVQAHGESAGLAPPVNIFIETEMPARYIAFSRLPTITWLVLAVGLLLLGLFRVIRRLTSAIYLQVFVQDASPPPSRVLPLSEAYCRQRQVAGKEQEQLLAELQEDLWNDPVSARPDVVRSTESTEVLEYRMVRCVRKQSEYFSFLVGQCTPKELTTIYHFARHGFLNYKNREEIDHLLEEGLLALKNEEVRLFSTIFRAYILLHVDASALYADPVRSSGWQQFRLPFLLLLLAAAAFLFFTQQEAWQGISALIAAFSTGVGLFQGILKGNAAAASPADSADKPKTGGKVGE